MPTVRAVMTPNPESVDASATVHEAVEKMRDLNVGIVPVVAGGRVQGVITDRDVTVRLIAENRSPRDVTAGEIATPHPVTITPEMDVQEASRLMGQHQVRRLPVVENGQLVGMLSLGDVSVDADSGAARQALRQVSTPAEPER